MPEEIKGKKRYMKRTEKIKRDMTMSFKANAVEWNYIRTMAQLEGLSLSDYLRQRAMQPKGSV